MLEQVQHDEPIVCHRYHFISAFIVISTFLRKAGFLSLFEMTIVGQFPKK